MNQNPEGGLSASITYAELKAHFDQHQGAEIDPQQRLNRLSGLKKYQDCCGRADTDPIGPELNGEFEQRRVAFLALYVNPGTAGNLKSCLNAWKTVYDELLEQKLPFGSFADALSHYIAIAKAKNPNLTTKAIANGAGISESTLREWSSKTQRPYNGQIAAIEKLEKVLEIPDGALSRFARPVSLQHLALERKCATPYRTRQAKLTSEPFRLLESQFSGRLVRSWKGYLRYKTDEEACGLERKYSWKLCSLSQYQGTMWQLPYLMTDGEKFVPTAQIQFGHLRTFFGALATIETEPVVQKYAPENFSLVWLADSELVKEGIKQLKSRYGKHTRTSKEILTFALSLVHPVTGFVTQHPELGQELSKPVEKADWSTWCAAQHAGIKKYIARLIEGNHFVEKTRDPFEPIQDYVDRQHPISILYELKESIARFIADHPSMPETEKKPLERTLFMIEVLIEQPLRVKMLAIMEYSEDNRGHLYKRADGTYAVRMGKALWKNERGAAKTDYDVAFRPEFTTKVDDYLRKVRPWFRDKRSLVFAATDSKQRQTRTRTTFLAYAFRVCTLRFLPGCIGFGPHSVRHLVATEYIKNRENGWQTAADVLHDTIMTVKTAYAFVKAEDGHKFYKSHLAEFEKARATTL